MTDQPPPAAPDDEIVIARLPLAAGVPVLLLPVRIETRFVSQPAVTLKGQSGGPSR